VCRQYGLFAGALDQVARQMEEEPVRDPGRERRLSRHLGTLGLEGTCAAWYDRAGHLLVEVSGVELDALTGQEETKRLGRLLGVALGEPEQRQEDGLTRLRWHQAQPLMAVAGVAARKKDGQTVSGDAGGWFKTAAGDLFVLLCDGMGSGPEARRESSLAVQLLEKFLRSGMEPEDALTTLNSALALRCQEEGGFTTIDLFRVDLYTGEAGFYKLGAAPTYVRRGGAVRRVTGCALPAGLGAGEGGPDVSKLRLEPGDSVVLVSDGVIGGGEDGWLQQALADYDGSDPKALAQALMEGSAQRQGATDDRTAVVLTIQKQES
jgi:stage II sporulation protein E